ncbi:MAG: 5'-nucleotidase C-terminal domain-containing protein, partial [Rikenellaceae bacterium]
MKRLLILVLLFFTLTHSQAQQQRLIVYGGVPWFAFDPITNSYQKGSLSQIWGYAEAWREELGDTDFFLMAHPDFLAQMPDSYRLYHECSGDSVMLSQIHSYIGLRDSVSSSFDLGRFLPDTIAQGELLVIDKWEMFGDVTLKAKMVDIRDFPNSSEFLSAQDHNIQTLRRYFSTPIVELDTVFTTEDCYFGASHLSGLFHRYQLETTGADLSLFAPSRQQFSWSAGGLYVKDIFQMLVYDNQLTVVTVSGALVLEFLE